MNIGNVCPAREQLLVPFSKRRRCMLPHEPAEDFDPVLAPFSRPVKMRLCKHCGGFYAEAVEESA